MTSRIIDLLRAGQPDQTVTIQGWVRTRREQKEFCFVEVNDGSSMAGFHPNRLLTLSVSIAVTPGSLQPDSSDQAVALQIYSHCNSIQPDLD
ncbi:hypothetical protein [Leptolyngbya sp. 7M]|uniref:hypothetical protein n=1 Tax=Leptolyngbya sp. 7M TaxID=2812896 RepID=UPI001B8BF967|nr:hypothetical protein [Leptolyngbya sp. 7M]QYO68915.1 hypothetical protein JVX88_34690 [Leptolyngbya sp. 7M]